MNDGQLKSLSRTQLLELMYQQEGEIQRLTGKLEQAKAETLISEYEHPEEPSPQPEQVFQPAPELNQELVFKPTPELNQELVFQPAPELNQELVFQPAPELNQELVFKQTPDIQPEPEQFPVLEFSPKPTTVEAVPSDLEGEILKSAKEAAERYLESVKNSGGEIKSAIAEMDLEAQRLRVEVEMRKKETTAEAERISEKMREVFEWQTARLKAMHSEFQSKVKDITYSELFSQGRMQEHD